MTRFMRVIHVFLLWMPEDVDDPDKPGHDDVWMFRLAGLFHVKQEEGSNPIPPQSLAAESSTWWNRDSTLWKSLTGQASATIALPCLPDCAAVESVPTATGTFSPPGFSGGLIR
ncbi:MAG: hypothetical protein U0942_07035 [Parvibaculum sp.]|nr:hypothetical protein [Parvibaculum sp.]